MSIRSEFVRLWNEFIANGRKISDLPAATTPLAGTEEVEINQGNVSKRVAVSNFGGSGSSDVTTGSVVTTGGTITLPLSNVSVGLWRGQNSFATAKAISLTDDSNGALFEFTFEITNVAATLDFGSGSVFQSTDTRFNTGTQVLTLTAIGTYTVVGRMIGSNWWLEVVPGTATIGVQDLFISAAAMWPRTTGGCAALAKTEMTTSLFNVQSLDFDQTTQEFAQLQIVLPRKYNNGTVTAVFYWTAASGSGDVQWGISGGAYSNDDALTVALGSAQTVDDTLIATNDLHITSATSAITLAGTPADADFLAFQISRNPASDTLSADAKLLGVSIRITTDSAIDA